MDRFVEKKDRFVEVKGVTGRLVVNLDHVTHILEDDAGGVTIHFTSRQAIQNGF
jgi:hypothetical protein